MNIIRDPTNPVAMIPLFCSWNIKRCNVVGCTEHPSTIISAVPDMPVIGMCETHYKEAEAVQKFSFKLEF